METFTDDAGVWEVSMDGKRKVMTLVEPLILSGTATL
jgi:hypothetical protein